MDLMFICFVFASQLEIKIRFMFIKIINKKITEMFKLEVTGGGVNI